MLLSFGVCGKRSDHVDHARGATVKVKWGESPCLWLFTLVGFCCMLKESSWRRF